MTNTPFRPRAVAVVAMVGLSLGGLTACGSSQNSSTAVSKDCTPVVKGVKTVKKGVLSIAVAEYPPYVTNKGGNLGGVDGDILLEVAKELCLRPEVETQSFPAIIESVKNNSVDLTAGNWYINDQRKQVFDVSNPVYKDQMAVVSKDGVNTISALEGKSVGTTQGYLWVADMQKALGKNNVKLYATEDAAYQDVKVGRISAAVITYGAGSYLLKSNHDTSTKLEVLQPDPRVKSSVGVPRNAVLIHKGDTALLDGVNKIVSTLRSSGQLAKFLTDNGLPASAADVSD